MDSLIASITHPGNLVIFFAGLIIPVLIGIILPRKKTIGYGRILFRFLGTCLAQTRIQEAPASLLQSILLVIRSTFVDLSFGVYIESRTDMSETNKGQKVEEYLNLTLNQTPVQPDVPPVTSQE